MKEATHQCVVCFSTFYALKGIAHTYMGVNIQGRHICTELDIIEMSDL